MAIQRIVDQEGLPPKDGEGRRRPLQLAVEPSYKPADAVSRQAMSAFMFRLVDDPTRAVAIGQEARMQHRERRGYAVELEVVLLPFRSVLDP